MPWTLSPGGRFGYLQRDCYAQLYCIPRRTRAGIQDAQLGSKAYFSVQNHSSCFQRNVQDSCVRFPGKQKGRLFPGGTDPPAFRPAPPRPDPSRTTRGISGFWIHQLRIQSGSLPKVQPVESKTRTYHGWERAGQNGTPTGRFAQDTTVPLSLWRIRNKGGGPLFGSTKKANRR